MIYTVLLNPSIDQFLFINDLQLGGTHKVEQELRFPVGKAVSVSVALHALGVQSNVIALVGKGEKNEYLEFLINLHIFHDFIPIRGKTRRNLVLIDQPTGTMTHIRFRGFRVTEKNIADLYSLLEKKVKPNDYVIFSGSLPEDCPLNVFEKPVAMIHARNAQVIIDTRGDVLKKVLEYKPLVIKGNLEEISTMVGQNLCDTNEFDHYPTDEELQAIIANAKDIFQAGARLNIITLGKYGALSITPEIAYYSVARLENSQYTIGPGDSFLAGLVAGMVKNTPIIECIRMASACAAANTLSLGAGNIKKSDVDMILPQVELREIPLP